MVGDGVTIEAITTTYLSLALILGTLNFISPETTLFCKGRMDLNQQQNPRNKMESINLNNNNCEFRTLTIFL